MAEYPSLTSAVEPLALGESVVAGAWLGDTPAFALADGNVFLGDTEDSRRALAHPDAAILVASSDGRRLVTGGDDGRVVAVDATGALETVADENGKWIDALALHEGAIAWSAGRNARARSAKGEVKSIDLPSTCRGLAFFPKGYRLAAAHYNGATLWFPNAGKPEVLSWSGSHLDATISPDGRFLVTSMQENTLHGWRIADAKHMRMAGYPGKTRSFSWSFDGKWLATSGADACILWPFSGKDGPMGQSPRECGVRTNVPVTRVAFHPGALVVAIGYEDGMALLARVTDGSEILVRRPAEEAKNARISTLAWDAKGARLLFGAENGDAGLLTLPKQ
ncbi:WD40 repeat domain-containing protein [Methylocystis sp. JR02]|uniref:WD40 repeat domain-containing protein n=1 Tax=Methylocystis sp. JR02 TaxID=3046284 RepID=UPI0024BA022A|nr:WD40 repeat domain-containing protein [Methylocystis sp. JR02]MDJ0447050.1 WD40 repeat domain-containing protein [Methylocystis sp. JR02]